MNREKKYRIVGARSIAPLFLFLFLIACNGGNTTTTDADLDADLDADMTDQSDQSDDIPDLPDVTVDDDLIETPEADLPDEDPVSSPIIVALSVTMNPNPAAPLVGVVTATTEPATRLRVTLESSEGSETIRYTQLSSEHRLPILGLLPGKIYTVTAAAETPNGSTKTHPKNFTLITPSLRLDFPDIQHINHRPEGREPGYILIVLGKAQGPVDDFGFHTVLFDIKGNIRWFYQSDGRQHGLQTLPNGNLLMQFSQRVLEVDMFGDSVGEWLVGSATGGPLAVTVAGGKRFHHSAIQTLNDTIIVLDDDTRMMENYPTSDTDPDAPKDTVLVRGDAVIEFNRDGIVLKQHYLLDILDPYRIGYLFIPGNQWSHANYALPIADDDSIVVSVRHQSCIAKFDRVTGDLRWILGNHEKWDKTFEPFLLAPIGIPFEWQWYQHNPKLTPDDTFLVFDNGNYRAMPFDPPLIAEENRSRAVEYRVDEVNMTVEQIWEWFPNEDPLVYTAELGDIHHLPQTGDVVVTFGSILEDTARKARIFEVTHTAPAEVLYELRVDDIVANEMGWIVTSSAFRSSLYPEGMIE